MKGKKEVRNAERGRKEGRMGEREGGREKGRKGKEEKSFLLGK